MTKVFIKDENVNLNFPDSMSQDEIRAVLRQRLASRIKPTTPLSPVSGNALAAAEYTKNADNEIDYPGFIPSATIGAPSPISVSDFLPEDLKAPETFGEAIGQGLSQSPAGLVLKGLGRATSALDQALLGRPEQALRALAGKPEALIGPAETVERMTGTYTARGEDQPLKDLIAGFVNPADVLAGYGIGEGVGALNKATLAASKAARASSFSKALKEPGSLDALINARVGLEPLTEEGATKTMQRLASRQSIAEQKTGMLNELGFRKQQLADLLAKKTTRETEAQGLLEELNSLDSQIKPYLSGEPQVAGKTTGLDELMMKRQTVADRLTSLGPKEAEIQGAVTAKQGGVTAGGNIPDTGLGEEIYATKQRIADLERNSKMLGKTKPSEIPTTATAHYEFDPVSFSMKQTTPVRLMGEVIPESEMTQVQRVLKDAGIETAKLISKDSNSAMIDRVGNLLRDVTYKVAPGLQRVTTRLQTMGEGGKFLSVAETSSEMARRGIAGKAINDYRTLVASHLTDDEFNDMAQVIGGFKKINDVNPSVYNKILPVMEKNKAITDSLGQMLQESGATTKTVGGDIQDFALVRSYFPSTMTPEARVANSIKIFEAGSGEEVAKAMREAGIPEDKVQSLLKFLESKNHPQEMGFRPRVGVERRGAFQHQRALTPEDYKELGLELPRFDKAVMEEYIMSASKKIADNAVYGNKQQKLLDALQKIKLQFGNESKQAKEAAQFINDITQNQPSSYFDKPFNVLRQMNAFRLGVPTTVIQLQQLATSGAVGTNKGFISALSNVLTEDGRQLATRLGVDLSNDAYTLQKLYGIDAAQTSTLHKLGDLYMKTLGIKTLDGLSRRVAGLTGRASAEEFFNVLKKNPNNLRAQRFFEDFGFGFNVNEALQRGHLTEHELDNAARFFDKQINFWGLVSDLPAIMNTKVGKLIFQYKPQAFMQTMMIKDVLIKEALRGNPAPLAKYLIAAGVTGEIYGNIKDAFNVRNPMGNEYRPSWQDPAERIASNIIEQGGGLGIISDLIQSKKFSKGPEDFVLQQATGPSFDILRSAARGVGNIASGKRGQGLRDLLKIPSPITPAAVTSPIRGLLRED